MTARPILLVSAAVLAALGVAGSGTSATMLPCKPTQVAGTFKVVAGSAGAGSISYLLRVTNRSARTCSVAGRAGLRLLGRRGRPLPTKVTRDIRETGLVRVVLAPGKAAKADAHFSPDVPGQGEPTAGLQCEPTAYRVRVTLPQGGTLLVRLSPPTPVCVHGAILLRSFRAA